MPIPLAITPTRVNFTGNLYLMPSGALAAIKANQFVKFPIPWEPVAGDPGIQIAVTNNAQTTPVAPILMDQWVSPVDGFTYYQTFVELSTVQPGQTVTETVAGLPVSQMLLVLFYLSLDPPTVTTDGSGFSVDVQAWKV